MSRDSEKPASLNEMMGKGTEISLDNVSEFLGEKMPELPLDRVGRLRLQRALKNRFGEGFRNIPGIKKLMNDFDKKIRFQALIKANGRR